MPKPDAPGTLPDDENSALARLAAALNPADPHPDRIASASDAVLLEIVACAREHRVSCLLSRAIDRAGRMSALPDGVRVALRQDVLDATMLRSRLDLLRGHAAEALDAAEVTFILLKGAALGAAVYAEPALRAMTDVDLLVAPRDLGRALDALARRGFQLPGAAAQAYWRDAYYNLPVTLPGTAGSVEIHWSIAQEHRQRPDIDGMMARRRTFDVDGRPLAVLGAADLFLHQALHHSYHYFEPRLVWIHDLALLHRSDPPVEEIRTRARRWGMSAPLALSVLQVEKAFPGAAHPDLLAAARSSAHAKVLLALFRSRRPVELFRGWERRGRQLIIAAGMMDRPTSAVLPVLSWLRRTLRHGDRAGHRIPRPGDDRS
jgi:hypothetical protein